METEESAGHSVVDQILANVVGYSAQNGNLLTKYNDHFYLNYFDRLKIDETLKKVPSHQKELELQEFVRLFLNSIHHTPEETLYLTMSLNYLYEKIKDETSNERGVKFADFTAYLCSKISEGDPDLVVPMREVAPERMVPDSKNVRDIDLNPALILSKVQLERPKITKDKNKKDKKLDEKKPLSKFIYSKSLNVLIALGRLSSSISLYNPITLQLQHKIIPSACKLMAKDVAILSMAFCEREKRIGCIINNIGVTFWEASDGYATEKILGLNKPDYDPKACGDKIYYLSFHQQWVTTDQDTIYFWDLKEEVPTRLIKRPNTRSVNDICEITHLRGLLVSYNSASTPEQKILILYQDSKQVSKLVLGNPGCHSLCYNPATQLIACLGYQSIVSIYQVDAKTLDINLVSELKAHSSILTCVCSIPDTSMIISGDDVGWVKLWDLNYMRCLQGLKIAKNLQQISCNGSQLLYADSRLNTLPMDNQARIRTKEQEKSQECYGVYHFFRKEEESLWIITRKEAREIRLKDGRTKNVLVVCSAEEQVSAAAELFNGFLIGTSKGELTKYALHGERKWRIMAHEGEIHGIKVDFENHLICTIGGDNHLVMWAEKNIMEEDNVRKRINFQQKDINIVELCPYANLLLVASTADTWLSVWNYDSIKLAYHLNFEATVAGFKIFADKSLILVSTVDGGIYAFKYIRKDSKFRIRLAAKINVDELDFPLSERDGSEADCSSHITEFSQCEESGLIVGSTPKGYLYCFEPTKFESDANYRREYDPMPSIKRPTHEFYEHEILKNQFVRCTPESLLEVREEGLEAVWGKKVHKDNITFQNILSLEHKYICSLCVDGYFKISELENGAVSCSRKITFPLPMQWDIQTENYSDLKNQIHEALSVLDSIIRNYSYELTIREQKLLNVADFMEKMINSNYSAQKQRSSVQLMSHEFTPSDIQNILPVVPTLKALEAYKRLELIKKHNQQDTTMASSPEIAHYETSMADKEAIRKYLEPNYLPELLKRGMSEPAEISGWTHMKKLEEVLTGVKKNRREGEKEKGEKENKNLSLLRKSFLKSEDGSQRNKSTVMRQEESVSVKKILSQINAKLHLYKKNRGVLVHS